MPPCRGRQALPRRGLSETWFGQLVCFLETQPERGEGASQQRAYVRWLSAAPHSALTSVLPFSRLKWSEHSRPDGRGPSLPGQAWYSLVVSQD